MFTVIEMCVSCTWFSGLGKFDCRDCVKEEQDLQREADSSPSEGMGQKYRMARIPSWYQMIVDSILVL